MEEGIGQEATFHHSSPLMRHSYANGTSVYGAQPVANADQKDSQKAHELPHTEGILEPLSSIPADSLPAQTLDHIANPTEAWNAGAPSLAVYPPPPPPSSVASRAKHPPPSGRAPSVASSVRFFSPLTALQKARSERRKMHSAVVSNDVSTGNSINETSAVDTHARHDHSGNKNAQGSGTDATNADDFIFVKAQKHIPSPLAAGHLATSESSRSSRLVEVSNDSDPHRGTASVGNDGAALRTTQQNIDLETQGRMQAAYEARPLPLAHDVSAHMAPRDAVLMQGHHYGGSIPFPLPHSPHNADSYTPTMHPGPHLPPPSTQYPSSFYSQNRDDSDSNATETSQEIGGETGHSSLAADPNKPNKHQLLDPVEAIRQGLGWLPASYLVSMSKEQLKELVMRAIENDKGDDAGPSDPAMGAQRRMNENTMANQTTVPPTSSGSEENSSATLLASAQNATLPDTSNQWFEQMGGGRLPTGWTAEYDYQQQAWYFINNNVSPPVTTWHDPRQEAERAAASAAFLSSAMPNISIPPYGSQPAQFAPQAQAGANWWPHAAPPLSYMADQATARAYADWHAHIFSDLQAHRQFVDGRKGPVEAELKRERKRVQKLRRAQTLIEEATRRLREATTGSPTEFKERERRVAENDLARAQGQMDRLCDEDAFRASMIPPWMAGYQGVTQGFDPLQHTARTHYLDGARTNIIPPSQGVQPFFAGPAPYGPGQYANPSLPFGVPGSIRSQSFPLQQNPVDALAARLPSALSMPTAQPIPRGVKHRGSGVPTPYGMPEVCFTWDMLLRSATPTAKLAAAGPLTMAYGDAMSHQRVNNMAARNPVNGAVPYPAVPVQTAAPLSYLPATAPMPVGVPLTGNIPFGARQPQPPTM